MTSICCGSNSVTKMACHCLEWQAGNPNVEIITGCVYLPVAPSASHPERPTLDDDAVTSLSAAAAPASAATESKSITFSLSLSNDTLGVSEKIVPDFKAPCDPAEVELLALTSCLLTRFHLPQKSDMLIMFDIPPHITIGELYELLSGGDMLSSAAAELPLSPVSAPPPSGGYASCPADGITHVQIVNSVNEKDTYAVFLKFRTHAVAEEFRVEFNGRCFNELEKEHCKVAFMSEVLFDEPKYSFPFKLGRGKRAALGPSGQHSCPSLACIQQIRAFARCTASSRSACVSCVSGEDPARSPGHDHNSVQPHLPFPLPVEMG
jgi:hypothetical protein